MHDAVSELEKDLVYLGLLDKAHEIYTELGGRAVLSYIKSSYRLLSKVYHPDLHHGNRKATITQQALNRVNSAISNMTDKEILDVIRRGMPEEGSPGRKKILIVEDDHALQKFFNQILLMEGYDSRIAEDGFKGYEVYQKFKPDLMLCDVVMPRLGGLELVEKLRKINPRVKVIYMSAFFGITPLKGRFDDEVARYGYRILTKPFRASEMLALIEGYLNEDLGQISGVDVVA